MLFAMKPTASKYKYVMEIVGIEAITEMPEKPNNI
jgi:hypothetical protein